MTYKIAIIFMAGWQSGYAAACKAVNAGSIPASASINIKNSFFKSIMIFRYLLTCPSGGIGRHKGLKIPR